MMKKTSVKEKTYEVKYMAVMGTFFLFPAVLLYYETLFKFLGQIPLGNFPAMILFAAGVGVIFQVIYLILPGISVRRIFAGIVILGAALVFGVECFVGKAFQTFMTFDSLLSGAGDVAGDFAGTVLQTILHGWYMILLFLLPFILFLMFKKWLVPKRRLSGVLSLVLLICGLMLYLCGHFCAMLSPVYDDSYQFDLSMRTLGVISSMREEVYRAVSGKANETDFILETLPEETKILAEETESAQETEAITEPETEAPEPVIVLNELDIDFEKLAESADSDSVKKLDLYLAKQSGSQQNSYTGLFKGKNLIMITAEAFSPYAVSKELTPTLYRLIHKGIYFSDYYQPAWGGSTSTGEYSVLTGLVPTKGVKSMKETIGQNLNLTIGNQLKAAGYYSAAFHNNSYTYYGRNETHTNFGYETFTGMGNGMEEGVENCWPQSDLEMMEYSISKYIDKQPFSVYYMTVSGHCAYSQKGNAMSKKNWESVSSLSGSDTVKAYIASQIELEKAMKYLLKQLKKAGILEDTVICLTSDHYPYGLEKGETWGNKVNYLPELYGCSESEIDKFVQDRNALILWSKSLETDLSEYAVEVSEPVYSLDILPTLSNLFGVKFDSRLLAGRDVFSGESALVIWPDYSWKTAYASYNARTGKLKKEEGAELPENYVESIKGIVKNRINLSKITLEQDYWKHVFSD